MSCDCDLEEKVLASDFSVGSDGLCSVFLSCIFWSVVSDIWALFLFTLFIPCI